MTWRTASPRPQTAAWPASGRTGAPTRRTWTKSAAIALVRAGQATGGVPVGRNHPLLRPSPFLGLVADRVSATCSARADLDGFTRRCRANSTAILLCDRLSMTRTAACGPFSDFLLLHLLAARQLNSLSRLKALANAFEYVGRTRLRTSPPQQKSTPLAAPLEMEAACTLLAGGGGLCSGSQLLASANATLS